MEYTSVIWKESIMLYRTRSKGIKEEKMTKTLPPDYLCVVTRSGVVRKDQVIE